MNPFLFHFLLILVVVFQSCNDDNDTGPQETSVFGVSNRIIVFSSNSTIYSISEDGTNQTEILKMGSRIASLDYSKSAQKILFTINDGDFTKNADIYIANPDGSNQIQVTNNNLKEIYPRFSGDGTKIAFTVENTNGFANLRVINTDGSSETHITNFTDSIKGLAYEPTWSSNDRQLFFIGQVQEYGLHAIDINGKNLKLIYASDSIELSSPAISPNVAKILCSGYRALTPEIGDIYSLDTNGHNLENLTNFQRTIPYSFLSTNPAWSNDGEKFSFTTNRDFALTFPSPYYSTQEIYSANMDGSSLIRLTNDTIDQRFPIWK